MTDPAPGSADLPARPVRRHSGSCHCGAVRFEIETSTARHYFCKVCGIYPFHRKRVAPDHFGINVHCLDDFDPAGIPQRRTVGAAMP